MREIITLACTQCKDRNYSSMKNKRNTPDKVELKNIVGAVIVILSIRKQSSSLRPVAQLGRAPVSKTGGWGFDSLLACQKRRICGKTLSCHLDRAR